MPDAYSSPHKVPIIKALKEGFSNQHIAGRIQEDRRTVDRIVKRLEESECERQPKSGRLEKTINRG